MQDLSATVHNSSLLLSRPDSLKNTLASLDKSIAFFDTDDGFRRQSDLIELRQKAFAALSSLFMRKLSGLEKRVEQYVDVARREGRPVLDPTYFFVKFRALAFDFCPYIEVVVDRSDDEAYAESLGHLSGIYVATRSRMILEPLTLQIARLTNHDELPTAVGQACALLVSLGNLEVSTMQAFFCEQAPPDALATLLEQFGAVFVSYAKSAVIRSHDLEQLKEVAETLDTQVIHAIDNATTGRHLTPVKVAVKTVHAAVLERLVFLLDLFITNEVAGYDIQPEDLDYPAALSRYETDIQNWYPPVARAVLRLALVFGAFDRASFKKVAKAAVDACLQTLLAATTALQAAGHPLGSQLFLLRHLHIIRNQVVDFKCDLVEDERGLDFGPVRRRVWNLMTLRAGAWAGVGGLLEFFLPSVHEVHSDGRRDIDELLLETCEKVVAIATTKIIHPLVNVVRHVSDAKQSITEWSAPPPSSDMDPEEHFRKRVLRRESFGDGKGSTTTTLCNESIAAAYQEFWRLATSELPLIITCLHQYLQGSTQEAPPLTVDIADVIVKDSDKIISTSSLDDPNPWQRLAPVKSLQVPIIASIVDAVTQCETCLVVDLEMSAERLQRVNALSASNVDAVLRAYLRDVDATFGFPVSRQSSRDSDSSTDSREPVSSDSQAGL
ncbi:MAG: hypothetical protein KVP17_001094 [Porospora cf. gigantea B]|nr:MAG: hypothetical protein KVP17_001094 [Porospora cf. gigantea B]